MAKMRWTRSPDATLGLLREGYAFIGNRCRQLGTDVFETRLMLQPTICMRGEEAAELFVDETKFTRDGAAPARLRHTLLGTGGVQGLDGGCHRHRKQMFLGVLGPDVVHPLVEAGRTQWTLAARRWPRQDEVVLFDEAMTLLCRAVCDWAGVPLADDEEVALRTADLAAMIDGGGGVGARYLRGRLGRKRSEHWAMELVRRTRAGELPTAQSRALGVVASHRDTDGELLPEHTAAVELLNLLRPTVAVARFTVFSAMALHADPELADFLEGGPEHVRAFVQEVRRFYPFFPFAATKVRETFSWRGLTFEKGARVLLDLYGTNHDPRIWGDPEVFRPARFLGSAAGPFSLVPQGAGIHAEHHRCPGEWATIGLMEVSVEFLTKHLRYEVPPQDLSMPLSRMPAIPESGFRMRNVERVEAARSWAIG